VRYALSNIFQPRKRSRPKFKGDDLLCTNTKLHHSRPNDVREKCYKIFYTLQYFGTPRGPPGPKFTNLGPDIQQGPLYQPAKFRLFWQPIYKISAAEFRQFHWWRDRQKSSTVNDVSAYHVAKRNLTVENEGIRADHHSTNGNPIKTRMWASAQRDGRPAEYRWRPLFNTIKFGWCPLLEWCAVTLPRHKTHWN